jgi:hypothetical protein
MYKGNEVLLDRASRFQCALFPHLDENDTAKKINKIPPSSASHEHDPSGKEHQCQHQEEIYGCDHGAVFHHLVLLELQCTLD